MKVIVAEHAGFCGGVKKAVKQALDASRQGRVYALGPLAHNDSLLDKLREEGVIFVDDLAEVPHGATVVIRSHGERPEVFRQAEERGLQIVDATCTFVGKLQTLVARLIEEGKQVIVLGDPTHPEIKGVLGWGRDQPIVLTADGSISELEGLNREKPVALVAQTTQRQSILAEIGEKLKAIVPVVEIYNTICQATALRQEAARNLAYDVDLMVVVGGKNSANTRKLADVCRSTGVRTIAVSEAHELDAEQLKEVRTVGVTAGASTPDWTIKEVIGKMENEKNTELQEEQTATEEVSLDQEIKEFSAGDVVTGTVVQVSDDEVLVDIGYKSEGVLPRQEVILEGDQTLADVMENGQEVEVAVKKVDDQEGRIILSRKAIERKQKWAELEKAFEEGTILSGKVKEAVPAGLVVELGGGYDAFMPGSLVDVRYIPDFNEFQGQEISFKIIEMRPEKEKLILSRKQVLEEEAAVQKDKVLAELEPGQIIKGTVKRLTNFGAFVDVGGIDGLVHISEISWHRIDNPGEVLSVSDEIEVKVIEVIPERERIGLSLRQAQPDPWTEVGQKFSAGDVVEGKVTRIVDFGAFVELIPGVEGLVHISQLANYHVKQPSEVVQQGDVVKVKILDINSDGKRVSLSMRDAAPRPKKEQTRQVQQQPEDTGTGVTLGDVFGDLFDLEKDKEE
ncbi:bifunctional 4-hydroxy-3-methylbut-2-enyl diphosphate reductase/30S ribosomal protein S1 [Dethiobacter alkaliphilus]|uniref:bifunctional 4-hydroxy-3-methylbut-2-enyl diphosphate reductase/30S ribosomal protein S1 n=1 Tax=Dethiobacter alkaliphilus TaxID=427926 RepID=UPI00222715A4|nr:bifunctional 4-hydroxy-3-methylbut-2-enyl diphosphate reductase/30S ribosomal protein S1 [Dethiobacter alkaliphilus]MCW3491498.1 bifunctional 4-hydroxy-3-methylbut-2-enyl diphosphate reductase/30S ribosomal protein S1 [Dethiobacter alkaliphilus]